jgi:2-polyprenyl-3-methyl-5-hydroxy-6-metoxy-1,4-benzoquinol methylase
MAQHMPDKAILDHERGVDLDVFQCSGCGLIQLKCAPVPYYREVVRAAAFSEEMKEFRVKQFNAFVAKYSLIGEKVIEIGCGRGEYLALMAQSGVEGYGVEFSEESVSFCTQNGLRVTQGYVESAECRLPHAPYKGFFILNFLEHFPDPSGCLRGILSNLEKGGLGLVEVPNFDMMLRKRLFSEFIGDHLAYFTKSTLATALELNGFEVMDCREIWHDYILSAEVRKREPDDLKEFLLAKEKIVGDLNRFISQYGSQRVAVWGAGHQALAVLSLAEMGGRIRYVVDSAVFKQGKYTPASHVLIVPPSELGRDPVDAVIVIAGSYSDEVAGLLRRQHGASIAMSILREDGLHVVP